MLHHSAPRKVEGDLRGEEATAAVSTESSEEPAVIVKRGRRSV